MLDAKCEIKRERSRQLITWNNHHQFARTLSSAVFNSCFCDDRATNRALNERSSCAILLNKLVDKAAAAGRGGGGGGGACSAAVDVDTTRIAGADDAEASAADAADAEESEAHEEAEEEEMDVESEGGGDSGDSSNSALYVKTWRFVSHSASL